MSLNGGSDSEWALAFSVATTVTVSLAVGEILSIVRISLFPESA